MNRYSNEVCNTIHILSNRTADDRYAAFIVDGGIIVKKNLLLHGSINIKKTLDVNNDSIIFKKAIIPYDKKISIGCKNNRWKNIHVDNVDSHKIKTKKFTSTNIDVDGDIALGNNSNQPVLKINNDIFLINGNLLIIDNNGKKTIEYNQHTNNMIFNTNRFCINGSAIINDTCSTNTIKINNYLQIIPQNITIKNNKENIKINSSLLFLNVKNNSNIKISLNTEINDIITKIVIKKNNNHIINIFIDKNRYIELSKIGEYIELFFSNNCINYIGNKDILFIN